MGTTKIKGIFKGFKFITQMFAVKERDLQIGHPTDVKHVAHIGWDRQASSNAPSWMNDYNTSSNFSSRSLSNLADEHKDHSSSLPVSTWSSQDFEQSMARLPASDIFTESPPTDLPKVPRKHKRKKTKSSSSSESLSLSSRIFRSKPKTSIANNVADMEITPNVRVIS
ncbi:hypothetical protein AQUCO_01200134v1 [Aquilegia coerulea]|uniref:CRIB domain-containing protein n=1 Tax=Aquilegia coerulea TaxID=218851 RepID=A0A2G5E4M4_AQUCA|nr:hypothetical protein AQUCO_01200134v1 [Aquilegia coerulea]